jgi:hypothetical protein
MCSSASASDERPCTALAQQERSNARANFLVKGGPRSSRPVLAGGPGRD